MVVSAPPPHPHPGIVGMAPAFAYSVSLSSLMALLGYNTKKLITDDEDGINFIQEGDEEEKAGTQNGVNMLQLNLL